VPSLTPLQALQFYFGYTDFRPGQSEIIASILSGKDTFALLPTGGGKSLCFQIPGLCLSGTTLVISPLIALMKDQVQALEKRGIAATYINSSLTEEEMEERFTLFTQGKYTFLYIAPERLLTKKFLDIAIDINIPLIAVDEAHCVSEWGHDFRPAYTRIRSFIAKLPQRPVITAFTATATPRVKKEIAHFLDLRQPKIFSQSFQRKNLFIALKKCKNGNQKLVNLIKFLSFYRQACGIIYCQTRKETEDMSKTLTKFGFDCSYYHAGLEAVERSELQDKFLRNEVRLITATNAFGMGVDKSNIRFVIHSGIPRNIEGYYQEIGRAGRDGEKSTCLFIFSPKDIKTWQLIQQKKKTKLTAAHMKNVKMFFKSKKCLTNVILKYFGQRVSKKCGNCSNCRTFSIKPNESEIKKLTQLAKLRQQLARTYRLPKQKILTSTQAQLYCLHEKGAAIYIPVLGKGWYQKFSQQLNLSE
jgi:ATP-dependent DNA helicase RecQ